MYSITEYVHNFYSIYNFPNPHIKSLFLWSDLTVVLCICRFLGGVERQIFQAYLTVDSLAFVLL